MCGIFAAVGCDLSEPALESVFQVLHHRGPDGRGWFRDESAALIFAHTRLAVLDLCTGAQPMESEDGNIVLVANGEIYDFERIRSALEAKGHRFKTKSDSEVIIYLYQEYGLACFEHLRGEFAFLLYDKAKRRLIAARDRFGIKPLYFSRAATGFVFASEMKAIFASGLVEAKLDVTALDPLAEQNPDNACFPFEGIEHVPPGCYLAIDVDTLERSTVRYWSPEIPDATAGPVSKPSNAKADAYASSVLDELQEAVKLRLRADVPVGLYLSGGIDSAFVGALMTRNRNAEVHSFSISFEGSDRNEQQGARKAADLLGTIHHDFPVSKQMLWDNLERCLWFSELPFATLAPVGKFLLSAEARKHVTVVLTGEGADEVFLGYRSYFQRAIRETREVEAGRRAPSVRARRLKLSPALQKLSLLVFHKNHRKRLAAIRAEVRPLSSRPLINQVQESRIAAMPLDILCYLGDREEMAHSLEARLPFLDHRLYDMAKEIPVDFKMRDGLEKAVLRDAAKDVLPDDVRLRRKVGFMLTSDKIDFFGADRAMTERLRRFLSREAFERSQVFSYTAYRIMRLLARFPKGKRGSSFRGIQKNANKVIMYMMQTHMLHEMFVENPPWAKGKAAPAS